MGELSKNDSFFVMAAGSSIADMRGGEVVRYKNLEPLVVRRESYISSFKFGFHEVPDIGCVLYHECSKDMGGQFSIHKDFGAATRYFVGLYENNEKAIDLLFDSGEGGKWLLSEAYSDFSVERLNLVES